MTPASSHRVILWDFDEAPEDLRALSNHGGDEDGVLFVPAGVDLPWWTERLWDMYGKPTCVERDDGTIYIWAHA